MTFKKISLITDANHFDCSPNVLSRELHHDSRIIKLVIAMKAQKLFNNENNQLWRRSGFILLRNFYGTIVIPVTW